MNSNSNDPVPGKKWIVLGAVSAAICVALGAWGAHGLETWLSTRFPDDVPKRLANWNSAVRYQMYHSLGLILLGLAQTAQTSKPGKVAGCLFLTGIALFSGCLYGWVLTDFKPLVHLVPIGGLALIVGWVSFAVTMKTTRNPS